MSSSLKASLSQAISAVFCLSGWSAIGGLVIEMSLIQKSLSQTNQTSAEAIPFGAETVLRPTLKPGSKGDEVMELQATLKLLGYYAGPVDGVYGSDTVTAVAQFQQAAGLPSDGIVGQATWNRLFPPTPAIPQSAAASTSTAPIQPSPNSTTLTTVDSSVPRPFLAADTDPGSLPILRSGMQGAAVTALQERLRTIGFFNGAVDGVFGAETEDAVKSAQRNFGLEADGVVGAATWSALLKAL